VAADCSEGTGSWSSVRRLFANWGALSVGVELADGEEDFHRVGARKRFDSQPSLAAR